MVPSPYRAHAPSSGLQNTQGLDRLEDSRGSARTILTSGVLGGILEDAGDVVVGKLAVGTTLQPEGIDLTVRRWPQRDSPSKCTLVGRSLVHSGQLWDEPLYEVRYGD